MSDEAKSKTQLIEELADLRHQIATLQQLKTERESLEQALRASFQELKIAYDQTILYAHDLRTEILERKRAEKTRAELEQQLRQAQKMEAIGRLAGGIAHDFNNLLTAIIGFSDLADQALPPTHPVSSDIQKIKKTAQRAADLTRQLLAFARRQVIQPQILNLNDLLLDLESLLCRLIGEDIELLLLLRPDLGQVKVDPGQFEQVLINLIINARDAMPRGGKLVIETANVTLDQYDTRQRPQVAPGEYVRLSVSDTGTGMTEEVKVHLFEPFFTTKEVGKGTGLGLATVHGIVEQNGGHIRVDSQLKQGTTFEIYLPRVKEIPRVLVLQDTTDDLVPGTSDRFPG